MKTENININVTYESPNIKMMEIISEGVLCGSERNAFTQDFDDEDNPFGF
ncbi:MAG: hypothetical protein ACI3ZQ_05585 [Candidatus Cryptobacteroides sp.]